MRLKGLRKLSLSISARWLSVGLWTALVCYLLLWPSQGTPVHDISDIFGGTELTDAVGHSLLAFIETLLLYGVLRHYWTARRALLWTLVSALVLGLVLELAQNWTSSRGATLMDVGANCLGVGLSVLVSRIVFPFS